MIWNLSDDTISEVAKFLTPRDFYNVRTVAPYIDDHIFWWRGGADLHEASRVACPAYVRYCFGRASISDVEIFEADSRDPVIAKMLLEYWHLAFKNDILVRRYIELGRTEAFRGYLKFSMATLDMLDECYMVKQWPMMASVFVYYPKVLTEWAFGAYTVPADADTIAALANIAECLPPPYRARLNRVVALYHNWLWHKKLDNPRTLAAIKAINSAGLEQYFECAMDPRALPIFLEYILINTNVQIPETLKYATRDYDKLCVIFRAQLSQKYVNLIAIFLILIVSVLIQGVLWWDSVIKIKP
jgi:hypothetical protein